MTFNIEALERQVREDDMRIRRQVARYEAHSRAVNAQIALAAEMYAQAVGSMWYLALNPNLGESRQ